MIEQENAATRLKLKIEEIARKLRESYIELNNVHDEICKVEEAIANSEQ